MKARRPLRLARARWGRLATSDLEVTPGSQASVDAYFDASSTYWSDIYGGRDVYSVIHQQRRDLVLARIDDLRLPAGSKVLEVGCGAGLTAVALGERGFNVRATDTAAAMIELARKHVAEAGLGHRIAVAACDVHALEFEDGTFDLVIALGVLPWVRSPREALEEMARVAKAGAVVIVTTDNRARLTYLFDPRLSPRLAPARIAVKKILRLGAAGRWGSRVRSTLHSIDEFDRLLAAAGLEKEEGRTLGFGPFTFLGHRILPERASVKLHELLQARADRGSPLAAKGAQYVVIARRVPTTRYHEGVAPVDSRRPRSS